MATAIYEFKSRDCKYLFRYDYEHCLVIWVDEDGQEIDAVGLSRENWDNVEAREEYLSEWVNEIEYVLRDIDLEEFL